jgi:glycosyltransferase involved in cell wall biosynthesis
MRILIVTQSVDINNPILGFFHAWVLEFSKHFESVTIICLEKGEYDLPENVKVLSLGKEKGKSKISYLLNFCKYIWQERNNYDVVFVHMNPIYVILGGLFWKFVGKRIGLWYVHKNIDTKLRLSAFIADYIFTASKESFRLESNKVHIVGHGIDTQKFRSVEHVPAHRIVTVGRVSKTKNLIKIVQLLQVVRETDVRYTLTIIGDSVTPEDLKYKSDLLDVINQLGLGEVVYLIGSRTQSELAEILPSYDIFVNLSETGSMDKAVLEAAASGLKIVTNNIAFKSLFNEGFVLSDDPQTIAYRLIQLNDVSWDTRMVVEREFNIGLLIDKIKSLYSK